MLVAGSCAGLRIGWVLRRSGNARRSITTRDDLNGRRRSVAVCVETTMVPGAVPALAQLATGAAAVRRFEADRPWLVVQALLGGASPERVLETLEWEFTELRFAIGPLGDQAAGPGPDHRRPAREPARNHRAGFWQAKFRCCDRDLSHESAR